MAPEERSDLNRDLASDRELLVRMRSGDTEAFDVIVRVHLSRLLRLAHRITGSADVAEDVVQNVFMRVWTRRETLDIDSDLRWYLWSAARNEARQHLRKQEVRERFSVSAQGLAVSVPSAVQNAASGNLETQELATRVLNLLEVLPPRCRDIFLLHWRDEFTAEEIASVYDISIRTVQNQIARAVRHLAGELLPRVQNE